LSQGGFIVKGEGCATGNECGDTAKIATADTALEKILLGFRA